MSNPSIETVAYPVLLSATEVTPVNWTSVTGVPCLYFHRLDELDLPLGTYWAIDHMTQIRWLASRGYETVTPDQLLDWHANDIALPAKPVMIMYDDSYTSVYRTAHPLLGGLGLTGVHGVITRLAETHATHCSWAQCVEMFDTHTVIPVSHCWAANTQWPYYEGYAPDPIPAEDDWLTALNDEQVAYEFTKSKSDIESNVPGTLIRDLVYPGGRHNETIRAILAANGYRCGWITGMATFSQRDQDPYQLERIYMDARLSSSYGTLSRLASRLGIPLSSPTDQPDEGDYIVDNGDDGYAEVGSWSTISSGGGYYGTNYRVIAPGSGGKATWTVPVPMDGIYDVYMSVPTSGGRAKDADLDITHLGGTTSTLLNQLTGDQGDWIKVQRCFLVADTPLEVTVYQNASADVVADAVMVRPVEEFVSRIYRDGGTTKLTWPSLPGVDFELQESGPDGQWTTAETVHGVVGTGERTVSSFSRRRRFRVVARAP